MLPLSLTWSETCCYYHGLASICIRRCGPPLKATFSKWPSRQINCPSLSLRAAATWASERFIPGGGGQRWSFPEGGQKDFFQDGATVAKFHFANSKARVKIIIYQKVNRILSPTCPPPSDAHDQRSPFPRLHVGVRVVDHRTFSRRQGLLARRHALLPGLHRVLS